MNSIIFIFMFITISVAIVIKGPDIPNSDGHYTYDDRILTDGKQISISADVIPLKELVIIDMDASKDAYLIMIILPNILN